MKRVFKIAMSVVVLAVIAGVWLQNRKEETKLSDLAMANIEALAANEIPIQCGQDELVGYFMTYSVKNIMEFGKPCKEEGYICTMCPYCESGRGECTCPEIYTVIEHWAECHPNTKDNCCCDKKSEGLIDREVI